MASAHRIFVLSPAFAGGKRGRLLLREGAEFDLALRVRSPGGAPLEEVYSFISGLYFRGKAAYARAFAAPPPGLPGALVITPTRGLVPMDAPVKRHDLLELAGGSVDASDVRYRSALEADARALARDTTPTGCPLVLLGSVASGKYVDVLLEALGDRLLFPAEFVGRGDMSRGGLMLRCVDAGEELRYIPVEGAVRRGSRPPRLAPR